MGVETKGLRRALLASVCGTMLLAVASPVLAQNAGVEDETADREPEDQIIVTGTLIRGVAPGGTSVITLSAEDIQETGGNNLNEVLARVPQVSNFFNTTPVVPSGNANTVNSPLIRNLPTLVLVDGHRIAGAGTVVTGVDPAIIPPGVVERVEIVPDGGSSIYGSDAVGGVINFTSKRRFDGVAANGRYGFADNYNSVDLELTAGTVWGSGSVYAAYTFSDHDAVFGRDREFIRQITPNSACSPGTITISDGFGGGTTYRLPDRTPNTVAICDASDNTAYIPSEVRHSVFVGLSQDFGTDVELDIRGFYTRRDTTNFVDQLNSSADITSANPFFVPIGTETTQTVAFSYAGAIGPSSEQDTTLDEWGVSSTLAVDLNENFQLRVLANYSRAFNRGIIPEIDTDALNAALLGTTTATAFNPYVPSQTAPGVISAITGRSNLAQATTELITTRAVVDGTLFSIPGGDVSIALGAEFSRENYNPATRTTRFDGTVTSAVTKEAGRSISSLFAQLIVPVLSGPQSLTLDASARFDDYSDIGSTFNPKIGITYEPVDWITLRGNYGTSFVAPPLADTQAVDTRAQIIPVSPFLAPGEPFFPSFLRSTILLAGGNPDLQAQTADTWTIGFEVAPPGVDGVRLSGSYYNIRYKNQLGIAPFFNPAVVYTPTYAPFVILSPTQAQAEAATSGLRLDGASSIASLYGGPFGGPYVLIDARRQNLARVNADGLDFSLNYNQGTSFGSIDASVAGTYILGQDTSAAPGLPFDDNAQFNTSRLSLSASLGMASGGFRASATLNHSAGYDLAPGAVPDQTKVAAYNVVDAFASYSFSKDSALNGITLTLNINNLFDEDPSFYNSGNGYVSGNVLGRYIQVGVRTKF